MHVLFSRARWRRWLLPVLAVAIVLLGIGLALKMTHTTQASAGAPTVRHLTASQITLATSTDVTALRASDGTVLWRSPYRNAVALSGNGLVLVAEPSQTVHLLDGRDGKLLWTHTLPISSSDGQLSPSLITPDVVIFQAQTWQRADDTYHVQVVALATSDGHLVWRYHEDNVMRIDLRLVRDMVLVADHSYVGKVHDISLSAFTAKTGALRWRYTQHAEHMNVYGVVGDALVIRGAGLTVLDVATGKQQWQGSVSTYDSVACVAGDVIYASVYATNINVDPYSVAGVAAFRLSDGALLWRHDLLPQRPTAPFACTAAGLLVGQYDVGDSQGLLYRLRGSDGAVVWQRPSQMVSFSGVVPLDEQPAGVIVNDATTLTFLDGVTGMARWHLSVPDLKGQSFVYPILSRGTLYLARGTTAQAGATLYAIDATMGTIHWQHSYEGAFTFGLDG